MAELSSAEINDLPDSDFAFIEAGGSKDSEGKPTPRSLRHFPIHDAAHVRNALARAPQSPFGSKAMPAIRAAAKKFGVEVAEEQQQSSELGTEGLIGLRDLCVRASMPGPQVERRGEGAMPILHGYLTRFDEWAPVESRIEGKFFERSKRGAFAKTIRDNRAQMRVLFHHGQQPTVGVLPLGPITELEERADGVYYESALFPTKYVEELLPALEAGEFGSSYTFRPIKDDWDYRPQRSTLNPEGLPEVTLLEVRMKEFGPCMFPVYAGATAAVRSTTDEMMLERIASDPLRLAQLLATIAPQTALSAERAEPANAHSTRKEPPHTDQIRSVPSGLRPMDDEEWLTWLSRNKSLTL